MSANDELSHYMTSCSRLKTENARLQERVEEAETEIGLLDNGNAVWLKVNERLIHDRDEARALAERRKKALEGAAASAHVLAFLRPDDFPGHSKEFMDCHQLACIDARAAIEEGT